MPSAEEIARGAKRKTNGKLSARLERVASYRAGSGGTDITAVDQGVIARCVVAVVATGAAIMLGLTSDGGALCITIFEDGNRHKEFLHGTEEIEHYLQSVEVGYGD